MIMGNIHLVTGYAGEAHVTSADMGAFNAAVLGSGQYVLGKGNKLAASVITNNQIRILDGDILMQGRHIRLNEDSHVDLTIENGSQGYMRNDLIVARYTKDAVTGVEDCNLVVIKGENAESNPSDPSYTAGDIIEEHAILNDMPLYRVPIDGLNVQTLVPLFTVLDRTIDDVPVLFEQKQEKTDRLEESTDIADSDSFPFYDQSAKKHKRTLWSNIKSVLGAVFAPIVHTHTKSSITDFPTEMSPVKHASRHAANGSDPVTPAAIGAVNRAGDTMDGGLKVVGGYCDFTGDSNSLLLNHLKDGERHGLVVYPNMDLNYRFQVFDDVSGQVSQRPLIHGGNLDLITDKVVDLISNFVCMFYVRSLSSFDPSENGTFAINKTSTNDSKSNIGDKVTYTFDTSKLSDKQAIVSINYFSFSNMAGGGYGYSVSALFDFYAIINGVKYVISTGQYMSESDRTGESYLTVFESGLTDQHPMMWNFGRNVRKGDTFQIVAECTKDGYGGIPSSMTVSGNFITMDNP